VVLPIALSLQKTTSPLVYHLSSDHATGNKLVCNPPSNVA
jgi:hypothetical protein